MNTPSNDDAPEPEFIPSVMPESLRRPYASLTPQKKEDTPADSIPAVSPLPSIDEKSGIKRTPSRAPSIPSSGTVSSRAVCKKHRIARGKDGRCMLCAKEELRSGSGAGWKVLVLLGVLAVLVGTAVAFLSP